MVQDDIANPTKFRKIFIVEASHDLVLAKRYSSRISLLTDGGELVSELEEKITKSLDDFDFDRDALIPMGKVSSCLIAGMVLRDKLPRGKKITIGIYAGDSYEFTEVMDR